MKTCSRRLLVVATWPSCRRKFIRAARGLLGGLRLASLCNHNSKGTSAHATDMSACGHVRALNSPAKNEDLNGSRPLTFRSSTINLEDVGMTPAVHRFRSTAVQRQPTRPPEAWVHASQKAKRNRLFCCFTYQTKIECRVRGGPYTQRSAEWLRL